MLHVQGRTRISLRETEGRRVDLPAPQPAMHLHASRPELGCHCGDIAPMTCERIQELLPLRLIDRRERCDSAGRRTVRRDLGWQVTEVDLSVPSQGHRHLERLAKLAD